MPQELHEQVPLIQEVLKTMHITVMTKEGYEADDILGTVARQAREKDYDVVIVSGDRDLLQLAEKHVLIRHSKRRKRAEQRLKIIMPLMFRKNMVLLQKLLLI